MNKINLEDWVKAAAAPWVATDDAAEAQQYSFYTSVFFYRLIGVV